VTVEFVVTTELTAPIEVAFDLSLDIDLHLASMSPSGERAIAGVTSRITELDRPNRFVDEQVGGPFRSFRHEHQFAEIGGGCRMTDRVRFVAPFGPIGRIVERALLGRYLRRLIETRNAYLAKTIRIPPVTGRPDSSAV
jgi:ligand-binding SRPBCC domain-containing protein